LPSSRVLDPLERTCEILFGVIVVLTFTRSISIAEGGHAETRSVLVAAIACNMAWGIVDAAMYLLSCFSERSRSLVTLRLVRETPEPDAAHRLILDALPAQVSEVLTPSEVEDIRQRLQRQPEPAAQPLTRDDVANAAIVFLLVFSSTFPVVIPFFLMHELSAAMWASNAIALAILFVTGRSLGIYSGRSGWQTGLGTALVGVILVAITTALGG
jgi:VIT1/CCC1 family predicted Fe2+/Mn2+ transporter